MIRRLVFLSILFSIACYSQTRIHWGYSGTLQPKDSLLSGNSGAAGVAIDHNKKIWVIPASPSKTDSVFVPDSNKFYRTIPVYIYDLDGTPAPFSPIRLIQTKELKNKVLSKKKTGITKDNNGNILLCDGNELVRINYKTGEGMNWTSFKTQDSSTLCKPAVDAMGNIYVSFTLSGHPIIVLNSDFTFQFNVTDTLKDIGRTTDVNNDGNIIWAHRYSASCTYLYHRASEFDQYEVDTVFRGFKIESSGLGELKKYLFISCGSYNDKPESDSTIHGLFYPQAVIGRYYGVDLYSLNYKIVDTVSWRFFTSGSKDERNSGIDLNLDSWKGGFLCLSAYGGNYYPAIEIYQHVVYDKVNRDKPFAAESYSLSQNYPNPFNPSTDINYSVAKEGFVTLKVYDLLGKEIQTLVNENLPAGNYSAAFNARDLSSGIYLYRLSVNDVVLSRKMIVMK